MIWAASIAIGVLVLGLVVWFAADVLPTRRLMRHLAADVRGIVVGPGDVIPWSALREVRVETTAAGPLDEDFFLVLVADGRRPVRIPSPWVAVVLDRVQALPGFDNEAVVLAASCAHKATFPCWQRPSERAT